MKKEFAMASKITCLATLSMALLSGAILAQPTSTPSLTVETSYYQHNDNERLLRLEKLAKVLAMWADATENDEPFVHTPEERTLKDALTNPDIYGEASTPLKDDEHQEPYDKEKSINRGGRCDPLEEKNNKYHIGEGEVILKGSTGVR